MENINKDLILREKLALQRTVMANQTTYLAYIRTSMYFMVAGLSVKNLLQVNNSIFFQVFFYVTAAALFIFGTVNFIRHRNLIKKSEVHVGNYQIEYLNQKK
jgi:putative membrane protein